MILQAKPGSAPAKYMAEKLGMAQRGAPERAMLEASRVMGGGVMNYAIEHVGDLTHRMSHMLAWESWDPVSATGIEFFEPKVRSVLRMLRNTYGFRREYFENMRGNAEYRNIPYPEYRAAAKRALHKYSAEHAKLPVFNRPQWLARQAAIELGRENFDAVERHLTVLETMLQNPEDWAQKASAYMPGKDGLPMEVISNVRDQ